METLTRTFCTTDDGVRLAYAVEGHIQAPALVFSGSLGTTSDLWARQAAALTAECRIVRYDTRGHGFSDAPPGDYSIDRLGRDLLTVIDAAGVDRAHVCGLSIGGVTAMWLGIHRPNRIRSLVLANTAAFIGGVSLWEERIRTAREQGMRGLAESATTRWFTAGFRAREADTVARLRETMEKASVEGYLGCCAALRDADLRSTIDRVQAPTLVIVGTHDVATPAADGMWIAQRISGASVVELDAAHLSNVERADEFSRAVAAFVTSEESGHG